MNFLLGMLAGAIASVIILFSACIIFMPSDKPDNYKSDDDDDQ